jgi:hypothetical protein
MSTTLAHRGLPSGVGRFDLLRLFEQVARPGFGLSSTAVALVRHYVLKTMDGDYLSGRICAVWTQACRFAEALGLTPRSINSAERELEQAGFIIRNAGINGERAGDRQDGIVVWAAGINLAPLVERFGEMQPRPRRWNCKPAPSSNAAPRSVSWASASARLATMICASGPRPSCPMAARRGSPTSTA